MSHSRMAMGSKQTVARHQMPLWLIFCLSGVYVLDTPVFIVLVALTEHGWGCMQNVNYLRLKRAGEFQRISCVGKMGYSSSKHYGYTIISIHWRLGIT